MSKGYLIAERSFEFVSVDDSDSCAELVENLGCPEESGRNDWIF